MIVTSKFIFFSFNHLHHTYTHSTQALPRPKTVNWDFAQNKLQILGQWLLKHLVTYTCWIALLLFYYLMSLEVWGREKNSTANCSGSSFPRAWSLSHCSVSDVEMPPSLEAVHVWRLIKWGFLFRDSFMRRTVHQSVTEVCNSWIWHFFSLCVLLKI